MPVGRSGDRGLAGVSPLVAGALVLLTRLPFLGVGYGTDNDAWSVIAAGRSIAQTGQYKVSRLPGFPIPEYAAALLGRAGPWAMNGVSALMGAAAAALLAVTLRRAGTRDPALGAVAFAFVPAVFIASTGGMDYLWACALLLAALVLALDGRSTAAGVALGLATACRITSIAFLLPLGLLLAAGAGGPDRRSAGRGRTLAGLAVPALLLGGAAFLPVYLRYGPGFLSYYEPAGGHVRGLDHFLAGLLTLYRPPFPPIFVAGIGTVGVWGITGCVTLAGAVALALARPAARPAAPRGLLAASTVAVLVSVVLFLRLPDDEGYLIPALPFAFVLLARGCGPRVFRALCVGVMLSPFVFGVDVTPPKKGVSPAGRSPLARTFRLGGRETFVLDPLRGPLLMDFDKRRAQMDLLARARERWPDLPANAVVIAGLLDLPLRIELRPAPASTCDILAREDLRALVREGRPILYFPDAPERTARFFHYSLDAEGARPFFGPGR